MRISAGISAMIDELTFASDAANELAGNQECFMAFARYYVSIMDLNQHATANGGALHKAVGIVAFTQEHQDVCDGIDEHSFMAWYPSNRETHAKEVEASLAFILLHELGHVKLGHIYSSNLTLPEHRAIELQADSWALDAAERAHQHMIVGLTPVWLTLLQGASVDWEQQSDHPLGVRRALNFFQTIKSQYENDPDFRRPLEEDGDYVKVMNSLQTDIGIASRCLDSIVRGQMLDRCN